VATDSFAGLGQYGSPAITLDDPPANAAAVTPNDSADLTNTTRMIYVGGAGAVALITKGGHTVTFAAVPVGTTLRVRANRILATGTTATNLLALW
jgi:hypothetical protein